MTLDWNQVEEAIYNRLVSDSILASMLGGAKVYNTRPPRRENFPFVVFSLAAGRETNETPRRQVDITYLIKAVATRAQQAQEIAERVDELLHDYEIGTTGWKSFWLRRDTVVKYVEEATGGREVWHVGAHYVLRVAETD